MVSLSYLGSVFLARLTRGLNKGHRALWVPSSLPRRVRVLRFFLPKLVSLRSSSMDLQNIALAILTWLCAFDSFQNLCSSVVSVAQFLLVRFHLSGYFNTRRELTMILLARALDELQQEAFFKEAMLSATASSGSVRQGSRVQVLLEIQVQFDNLQKLLQAYGPNPVWSMVYGSQMDALLSEFAAVLGRAAANSVAEP